MTRTAEPIQPEHATSPALPEDPRPGTRPLAQSALGALGIELVSCSPDAVVGRMPCTHPGSTGALLVLAETLASTAAGLAAGPLRRAFGAELNASFPSRELADGTCVGVATPLRLTDDSHVWAIEIVDVVGTLALTGRCTLSVVTSETS